MTPDNQNSARGFTPEEIGFLVEAQQRAINILSGMGSYDGTVASMLPAETIRSLLASRPQHNGEIMYKPYSFIKRSWFQRPVITNSLNKADVRLARDVDQASQLVDSMNDAFNAGIKFLRDKQKAGGK